MADAIIKDDAQKQFYIQVNGKRARLKYQMKDENTIEYVSTFVPEEYRGKSLASELVSYGLNYARENKLKVIPTCPYVKEYLDKNKKEFEDIEIEK